MSGLQWLGFPAALTLECDQYRKVIFLRERKQARVLAGLGGTVAPINERRLIRLKVLGNGTNACVVRATSCQIWPSQGAAGGAGKLVWTSDKALANLHPMLL
jgi:hypothetical protein